MQAANTGLTEGSDPPTAMITISEIVIISTLRLDKLHLLDKGEQVLAWPGTTLYSLEKRSQTVGTRTALGDRFVMHRRIGHRRDLQQLRRLAGAARAWPTLRCRCSRRLTPTAS